MKNLKTTSLILLIVLILTQFVFATTYSDSVVVQSDEDFNQPVIVSSENDEQIRGGEKEKMWSKKELCNFMHGCFAEYNKCYPYGFRKESQYCGAYYVSGSIERRKFLNQSKTEENCTEHFECESNFCFNGKCVSKFKTLIKEVIIDIKEIKERFNGVDTEKENNESLEQEKMNDNENRAENISNNTLKNSTETKSFFHKLFWWR